MHNHTGLHVFHSPPQAPSPTIQYLETIHKEVGQELLERERSTHRKQGEVPYPLRYESAHLNAYVPSTHRNARGSRVSSDTVDHLIITELCGGLTLHRVDLPPRRVLDLGCGGGQWILSCARQWKVRPIATRNIRLFSSLCPHI